MDRGIDLGTGQAFKGPATAIRRTRQNEFRPAPQFRGIDGVFVPNGALGPVVISSTGLLFSACPPTMGSYYGGPANSGKFFDIPSRQIYTARLQGVSFGTATHPALNLHPNAGITFDLDRIRQDNPDIQIDRFTAVCGIPKDCAASPVQLRRCLGSSGWRCSSSPALSCGAERGGEGGCTDPRPDPIPDAGRHLLRARGLLLDFLRRSFPGASRPLTERGRAFIEWLELQGTCVLERSAARAF